MFHRKCLRLKNARMLTQFYSLSMRQAGCIKTGRCFWLCTGGRRVKVYQTYPHTHQAALGDIWASVSTSRMLWQVDCGSPGSNADRRIWKPAIWVSCVNCHANQLWKHHVWDSSVGLRGVIAGNKQSWQVMTSLQSGSSWRLWAADKWGAACECQACSCVGGNGARVDGKVRTHTGVQMKMCTQKISGSPQMLPHWAEQQDNN